MARLCIADPPYLGCAERWYGGGNNGFRPLVNGARRKAGDVHHQAYIWDDPETHRELVARLCAEYDGWAIAMNPDNLRHYLQWVPSETRVCAWLKPDAVPGGGLISTSWEPVLLLPARRGKPARGMQVRDAVSLPVNAGAAKFPGAKPPAWTRWVLDMLGYNPDEDTVDDLFHGSGAVAAEIAQGVLL
jgi:hypothetical protein